MTERSYEGDIPMSMLPDAVELALAIQHWTVSDEQSDTLSAHRNVRDKHDVWIKISIEGSLVSVHYVKSENLDERSCYSKSEVRGICSRTSKALAMCDNYEKAPTCIHSAYAVWIDDLLDEVFFAARQLEVISRSQK